MPKTSNLALTKPSQPPEKLTYKQFTPLAQSLAMHTAENDDVAGLIFLLLSEITQHCQDFTHVEDVASSTMNEIFFLSMEYQDAKDRFVSKLRKRLVNGDA